MGWEEWEPGAEEDRWSYVLGEASWPGSLPHIADVPKELQLKHTRLRRLLLALLPTEQMSRGGGWNESGSHKLSTIYKFCRLLTLSTAHQTHSVLQGLRTRHSWAPGLGLCSSSWLRDSHLGKARLTTGMLLSVTPRKDRQDGRLQRAG